MTTQNLEIVISSTVSDAVKGLDQVDKALDDVSKSASGSFAKSMQNINNLQKQVANTSATTATSISNSLNKIPKAASETTSAVNKLNKSTINAGQAATNFGRIISDLPYGFIAIQNNIDPLIQSLGFGSGLGLAITLVGSALTTLSQNYGGLGNAVNALLFPLSQQEKIQKGINEALDEGAKNALSDVASLDSLYRAATNTNIPLGERNKIVDELQRQYPKYLGNLSNEQILAGQAATAYQELRNAIIAKAQAQALGEKIAEIEGKRLPLLREEQKLRNYLLKNAEANAAAQRRVNEAVNDGEEAQNFVLNTAGKVTAAYSQAVNQLRENQIAQGDLNEESREYANLQDQIIQQFGAFAAGVGEVKKQIEGIKALKLDPIADIINPAKRQDFFQAPQKTKFQIPVDIQLVGLKEATDRAQQQIGQFQQGVVTKLQEVDIDVQRILQQGAATIATGLGNAIGALVSGAGGLQNAFNSLIGVFADFLSQIGQSLIAAGTATIAAQALATNPYTAIAAGILANAAGAAVRSALKNTPSFATGGAVVGGPTLAMIGDNPGREEYVIPSEVLDKMGGGGDGFIARTEISANNLAILVYRGLKEMGRTNG